MPGASAASAKCEFEMSKRSVTSICYVVALLALIVMKWFIPGNYGSLGFDALFTALSVIGCYEMLRAVNCVSKPQKAVAYVYCSTVTPLFAIAAILSRTDTVTLSFFSSATASVVSGICVMIVAAMLVFDNPRTDMKSTVYCIFTMLYCGVCPLLLSAVNHLSSNSLYAIVYMFGVTTLTDAMAYLVGVALHKKFPRKLAPHISPNKTVIGSIGGIIGGVIGAAASYYLYVSLGVELYYTGYWHMVIVLSLFSVFLSVIAQVGDLFESAIKRECGIKDMGDILPGHGGMLDRFDSMMFSGPVVLLIFAAIAAM